MRLPLGHHLAYCTNIHPGETWAECLAALETHTLAVRDQICPGKTFAIGLRLSDLASRQLNEPSELLQFRRWLDRHDCYVFTINGFPYGQFHGTRVKEQVYRPDWTTTERLEYTNRLFDILSQLLPDGVAGSVSTVPGSFKEFITTPEQVTAIRRNLRACAAHIANLSARSKRELHLGLEPEPLCLLETTGETVDFFDQLREDDPLDERLGQYLGINYDTCHLAVEFEEPAEALALLQEHRIRISKIHLSNALKVRNAPTAFPSKALTSFADGTYFHQAVTRAQGGSLTRFRDLDAFLAASQNLPSAIRHPPWEEARIHFHIPLHTPPGEFFQTTSDHLLGVLDVLQKDPKLCAHLEMETYTWGVLPPELKSRNVADQLASEYRWCLAELARRGLA